jgi:Protein of unknown function (DUF3455)
MRLREKTTLVLLLPLLTGGALADPLPDALAAPGTMAVLTAHAQGEQIYQCKAGSDGKLAWSFLEPAAALTEDGKVVGRHYAGPTWELGDGSALVGKVVASAPGRTANDIAWLKLEAVSRRGSGRLSDVTTVQRINTVGGKLEGPCEQAGNTLAMPYAADYVFLRKI